MGAVLKMVPMKQSDMKKLNQAIADLFFRYPDLVELQQQLQGSGKSCWLVGGAVRDLLLGRVPADVDLACDFDPTSLAKAWSAGCHGRWFWLDEERRQSRVLLKDGLVVDFVPLRAENLDLDLGLRDFTINALALDLSCLEQPVIHDPLGGQLDLRQGLLRHCGPTSFSDDPLRMLKGVRHAVTLNLKIAQETMILIRQQTGLLTRVAGERRREELFKILETSDMAAACTLLHESGLLQTLFGPGPGEGSMSVVTGQVQQLSDSLSALPQVLLQLCAPFRRELLLAYIIEVCRPPRLRQLLAQDLRLSRVQQRMISALQTDPGELFAQVATLPAGQRRRALACELFAPFAVQKLVFWGVCRQRLEGEVAVALVEAYNALEHCSRIPDLLSGAEVQCHRPDLSGDHLGDLMQQLKYLEITGVIRNKNDASNWLKDTQ